MRNEIALYDYWRSSSSWRLRIAFNLLKLPYVSHPVNLLNDEQTSARHLERNPQGLVPAVEIDGLALTQSVAVLEYLNETYDAGFLPADAVGKARVRALTYAIAMEIQPVCNLRVAKWASAESDSKISIESWMAHFITIGLEGFEQMLHHPSTSIYCHGDKISMADICLVPQIYNARRWNVDLSPYRKMMEITERLEAIPEIIASHPEQVKPV